MLQFSSEGGIKEYPITPRQVSPSPVNLYINFALSLRFMALKEFVPAPQTHVSLCRTLGGGGTWREKKTECNKTVSLQCSSQFLHSSRVFMYFSFWRTKRFNTPLYFFFSFICELFCFSCEFVHFSPLEKMDKTKDFLTGFPSTTKQLPLWKLIKVWFDTLVTVPAVLLVIPAPWRNL